MKYIIAIFIVLLFFMSTALAQKPSNSSERLQAIYSEQQINYTPERLQKIASRCEESQKSLFALRRQNSASVLKRITVYSDLQKEMKAIELRLSKQGADASELDLLIGKQQVALEALETNYKNYDTLLSDLMTINCVENQNLYAAGITEIFVNQKKIRDSASELYKLLQESPNTTFKPLAKRLTL